MADELTTAVGDDWREIAEAVRTQLKKRMVDVPIMQPTELLSFINALSKAEEFERDVTVYDKNIQWRIKQYEKSWTD